MERARRLAAQLLSAPRPGTPSTPLQASSTSAAPSGAVPPHGGNLAARALAEQGVRQVFTLTGGHISPILVGCNQSGIRVVDVRDEATTVFAADAVSRLSGTPGVAIVTAGPGLTNTITAVKNAQMAQSAVVVMAGATAMLLKGRGSLQDIDQFALMKPHVKMMVAIKSLKQIVPAIRKAFRVAQSGVPGPVFIEFPLEVIWPREVTEDGLGLVQKPPPLALNRQAIMGRLQHLYLQRHMNNVFHDGFQTPPPPGRLHPRLPAPEAYEVSALYDALAQSRRPIILIGSQAIRATHTEKLVAALERLGAPVYLSGMGRGLLGKQHRLHMRHKRRLALAKADWVLLAGVPADFRLDYGRHVSGKAYFAAANLSRTSLRKNNDLRKPSQLIHCDPMTLIVRLAEACGVGINSSASSRSPGSSVGTSWGEWFEELDRNQQKREAEIDAMGAEEATANFVNPIRLCREIDAVMDENSVIVADGGDFVGTASYICRPRGPLCWLDPGVFGTLGVGGGFALGAGALDPDREIWVIFGDGSVGWSLSEFDTYVRHKIPVIAVVGNDACWSQMYRDQIRLLKDPVATELEFSRYDEVVKGFGAEGILVQEESEMRPALLRAKEIARTGKPVLVNCLLSRSKFREGSISI